MYSKEDCIRSLQKASKNLGKSPTIREYNNTDFKPAADTIIRNFGTWNKAKEAAGLDKIPSNDQIEIKPNNIELPKDKKWAKLTPYQRYYYKNRESEIRRSKKRTEELKNWFEDYKKHLECEKCGEDHPACLDFHHEQEKSIGVSELVNRRNSSKKRIKEEISKCTVLCANCHRKIHHTK